MVEFSHEFVWILSVKLTHAHRLLPTHQEYTENDKIFYLRSDTAILTTKFDIWFVRRMLNKKFLRLVVEFWTKNLAFSLILTPNTRLFDLPPHTKQLFGVNDYSIRDSNSSKLKQLFVRLAVEALPNTPNNYSGWPINRLDIRIVQNLNNYSFD